MKLHPELQHLPLPSVWWWWAWGWGRRRRWRVYYGVYLRQSLIASTVSSRWRQRCCLTTRTRRLTLRNVTSVWWVFFSCSVCVCGGGGVLVGERWLVSVLLVFCLCVGDVRWLVLVDECSPRVLFVCVWYWLAFMGWWVFCSCSGVGWG